MLSESFDELIQAIRDGNEKLQELIYRRLEITLILGIVYWIPFWLIFLK